MAAIELERCSSVVNFSVSFTAFEFLNLSAHATLILVCVLGCSEAGYRGCYMEGHVYKMRGWKSAKYETSFLQGGRGGDGSSAMI